MSIRDQVVAVMSGLGFQLGELADGASMQDLGIDSTELVEIVVALEKHFAISIDSEVQGTVTSVGDLVSRVSDLLATDVAMKG
ncbi:MAG: acyl carrier protein [Pseudonocardiales bacterium]|nr:acyl carrier protein [Pseudonocardiales bacterium]MBV9030334.1 acyl carrier protein [Pseudonocardiales bacterium]